jgi:hypothetical protein
MSCRFAGLASSSYFTRSKFQYEGREDFLVSNTPGAVSNIPLIPYFFSANTVSVSDDWITDDTAALSLAFKVGADSKRPVFVPASSYIVSDTVFVSYSCSALNL